MDLNPTGVHKTKIPYPGSSCTLLHKEHKLQDTRVLLTSEYEVHLPYITKPPLLLLQSDQNFGN